MRTNRLHVLALVCLMAIVVWLVLLFAGVASTSALRTLGEAVRQAGRSVPNNTPAFLAALVLTLLIIVFFVELYNTLKFRSPVLALIGLFFIPIYGTLNLVAYLSHLTFISGVESLQESSPLLSNLVAQASPQAGSTAVNLLAYSLLGVPCLVFGVLLARRGETRSGRLLALSGIASIIGFVGLLFQSTLFPLGVAVGGVLFVTALIRLARKAVTKFLQPKSSGLASYAKRP